MHEQLYNAIKHLVIIINSQKLMSSNDKNNRSLLAFAAQKSLGQNLSMVNASKVQPKNAQLGGKTAKQKQKQKDTATRKLMMKLTLPRLRKMQALVRGFLVRRKVYPSKLEQYLVAKSILNLVISNVVYRESSEIILQSITYLKYEPDRQQSLQGYQKTLQSQVCNRVLQRVFHKQITKIVELAVAQHAKMLSRPKITFGFNLRDPLQLLLFDTINNFVGMNYKQVVRQAIQECVNQNRELRVIDEWIDQYNMLPKLYEQIVNQALNESIGEYIVQSMLERIWREGAQVVARVCFDEEVQQQKQSMFAQIQKKMLQWMLQQSSVKAVATLGHFSNK